MQIGVIGGSIWGNRGAEAMVATCAGHIRRTWPTARVCIFSYFPARDSQILAAPNVVVVDARPLALVLRLVPFSVFASIAARMGLRIPDWCLPREVAELRRCRLLLDVFGISFADGRSKFLPFNVLSILPAFLLGVPVVKMSQAMGPFRNPLNRTLARATLKRCVHVFARGSITTSHLESLPLQAGRHSEAGDLAFLYRDRDSLSHEGESEVAALLERLAHARAGGSRVTGISPSSVVYEKARRRRFDYIGLLATLVHRALSGSDHVVVLPNATRQGSRSLRNNDLPVIEMLRLHCARRLPPADYRRIHWLQCDVNTRGIRAIIAGTDILVTSRFHAMIAALSVGTSPLVIGWSHKYDEVLQPFGPAAASFDIGSLDADSMLRRFADMRRDARPEGRQAGESLARMERSSERQLAFISSMIDSIRSPV